MTEEFQELKRREHIGHAEEFDNKYFSGWQIRDTCLDKQRVREVIEKLRMSDDDFAPPEYDKVNIAHLLQELGL